MRIQLWQWWLKAQATKFVRSERDTRDEDIEVAFLVESTVQIVVSQNNQCSHGDCRRFTAESVLSQSRR